MDHQPTGGGAPMDDVVDLTIDGMTCAACATRIERALHRIDGVSASVNVATERARVTTPHGLPIADLLAAVADAGYTAAPLAPPAADRHPAGHDARHRDHADHADHAGRDTATTTTPPCQRAPRRGHCVVGWSSAPSSPSRWSCSR